MKEALFYEKIDSNRVHCFLCPRDCKIATGNVGYCGVRENINGTLYSLIYNVVSSIANDPIEKKPLFHFYPGTKVLSVGTYGCNMRCGHCQNWQIAHINLKQDEVSKRELSAKNLVDICIKNGSSGIAWTYNEPSIWFEYAFEGAKLAKEKGLYTVWVTNGYVNVKALEMISPYLDAFRVDIKGFTNEFYMKIAKVPDFSSILYATECAKNLGMHVECITNIIPTMNDCEKQLTALASFIKEKLGADTPWHVTKFNPYLEYSNLYPTPIETLEKAKQIGESLGLKYVYIGNVPGHEGENTYCPRCKNLLIKRTGFASEIMGLDYRNCSNCGELIPIKSSAN